MSKIKIKIKKRKGKSPPMVNSKRTAAGDVVEVAENLANILVKQKAAELVKEAADNGGED